jgi:uncharacterized protein (DUF2141 family)
MRHLFAALLALPLLSAATSPGPGTLTINVDNVRIAKGRVHVDVCPETKFLKDDCPWSGNARARVGLTSVTVTGLPPGRYAVQAFLDENSNGEVDRGLFGIPKEGIGFSNDARIKLGPPKFEEAAFSFGGPPQAIHLSLRYFTGAKGPAGTP